MPLPHLAKAAAIAANLVAYPPQSPHHLMPEKREILTAQDTVICKTLAALEYLDLQIRRGYLGQAALDSMRNTYQEDVCWFKDVVTFRVVRKIKFGRKIDRWSVWAYYLIETYPEGEQFVIPLIERDR